MVKAKTMFLVLVMAVGAIGGAPLNVAGAADGNKHCAMKCCKKKVKAKHQQQTHRPNFCRLTACMETVPSVPSSQLVQPPIAVFQKETQEGFYLAVDTTRPKEPPLNVRNTRVIPPNSPVFVLHASFLL